MKPVGNHENLSADGRRAFIATETRLVPASLVPEIRYHGAEVATALWEATEATLNRNGLPPPYWAFAWPGGQALARLVLDRPERVLGKVVLDLASGAGIAALAAARAGAARAIAVDIDPFAETAALMNAAANGLSIEARTEDLVGTPLDGIDLVLAGDVCYERPMAERMLAWLAPLASRGLEVLLADPGRAYLPKAGLEPIGRYVVPTTLDLEDRTERETVIYRLLGDPASSARTA